MSGSSLEAGVPGDQGAFPGRQGLSDRALEPRAVKSVPRAARAQRPPRDSTDAGRLKTVVSPHAVGRCAPGMPTLFPR